EPVVEVLVHGVRDQHAARAVEPPAAKAHHQRPEVEERQPQPLAALAFELRLVSLCYRELPLHQDAHALPFSRAADPASIPPSPGAAVSPALSDRVGSTRSPCARASRAGGGMPAPAVEQRRWRTDA